MQAILEQVFASRIEAVEALRADDDADGERLRRCAERVREGAAAFGRAPAARDWHALAAALGVVALLLDWRRAVLNAEADGDRFLRAARLRLDMPAAVEPTTYEQAVTTALEPVSGEFRLDQVPGIRSAVGSLPMPLAIFADPPPTRPPGLDLEAEAPVPPETLAVAFLEFVIDGRPAETLHSLRPCRIHDLDLSIRVSRWPEAATSLVVGPVSIEPPSTWDLPTFEFGRPAGEPPHVFQRQGRMTIHASQGFAARPLEFVYAAEFQPSGGDQPVVVAGQRRLRLDGTDPAEQPITGYAAIDAKIVSLRERLRREPLVAEDDVRDLLVVLAPLGNLVGQAVQDALYPTAIGEAAFQEDVRRRLRSDPAIGSQLEEQAHSTGGRTDLSFRGIRIELKSERKRRLVPKDCEAFAGQAASYAVGTGRRVAVLCVLDCSPNREAPFPADDGLFIQVVETGASPVYVVTCLVQGGLAKPSSLSR